MRVVTVLLILASFAFSAWVLSTTSKFESCATEQAAAEAQKPKENSPPIALTHIAMYSRCGGHVVYEYRDAVIAVATVFLAIFTFTLWLATHWLLKHGRESERAYVSGGGQSTRDGLGFQVQINNYGKTPAKLLRVGVGFCGPTVPPRPTYTWRTFHSSTYKPGDHAQAVWDVDIPSGTYSIIYGRFEYRDVWKKKRKSSFILPLREGVTIPTLVGSEYTYWD